MIENLNLKGIMTGRLAKLRISLGKDNPPRSFFSMRIDTIFKDETIEVTNLDEVGAIEIQHNNLRTSMTVIPMSKVGYIRSINIFMEVLDNTQTADIDITIGANKIGGEVAIFIYGLQIGSEHVICPSFICDTPNNKYFSDPVDDQDAVNLKYYNEHTGSNPTQTFFFNFSLQSFANKNVGIKIHKQNIVGTFLLRITGSLCSNAASEVDFQIYVTKVGEISSAYKMLVGKFLPQQIVSHTMTLLGDSSTSMKAIFNFTSSAKYSRPEILTLTVEKTKMKSLNYSGKYAGLGYIDSDMSSSIEKPETTWYG